MNEQKEDFDVLGYLAELAKERDDTVCLCQPGFFAAVHDAVDALPDLGLNHGDFEEWGLYEIRGLTLNGLGWPIVVSSDPNGSYDFPEKPADVVETATAALEALVPSWPSLKKKIDEHIAFLAWAGKQQSDESDRVALDPESYECFIRFTFGDQSPIQERRARQTGSVFIGDCVYFRDERGARYPGLPTVASQAARESERFGDAEDAAFAKEYAANAPCICAAFGGFDPFCDALVHIHGEQKLPADPEFHADLAEDAKETVKSAAVELMIAAHALVKTADERGVAMFCCAFDSTDDTQIWSAGGKPSELGLVVISAFAQMVRVTHPSVRDDLAKLVADMIDTPDPTDSAFWRAIHAEPKL